jgi:uncharacterized cofD-like protein
MADKAGKKDKRQFLHWFYPGIRIKRYIVISALGVIVASLALAIFVLLASTSIDQDNMAFLLKSLTNFIHPWIAFIFALILFVLGIYLVVLGVQKALQHTFGAITVADLGEVANEFYKKTILAQGPEVVVIGGGTGLATLLRGLKDYTSNITAIVTAADDGGSSGRIKKEWGLVPPGDIRSCLLALAETEPLMKALFDYRFQSGEGLEGHNFGNLFILAMSEVTGDFETAVEQFSRVLKVRGQVVASTLDNVNLKAIYENGHEVLGESVIGKKGEKIKQVELEPKNCKVNKKAIEAIERAELIILGPGSLYTSIIPNLLVPGLVEAIQKKQVPVYYIVNVMTEPGETDNYTAFDHVKAILDQTNVENFIDYVFVNTGGFDGTLKERYKKQGAFPVEIDQKKLENLGVKVVLQRLANSNDMARHDSDKLASVVMSLYAQTANKSTRS